MVNYRVTRRQSDPVLIDLARIARGGSSVIQILDYLTGRRLIKSVLHLQHQLFKLKWRALQQLQSLQQQNQKEKTKITRTFKRIVLIKDIVKPSPKDEPQLAGYPSVTDEPIVDNESSVQDQESILAHGIPSPPIHTLDADFRRVRSDQVRHFFKPGRVSEDEISIELDDTVQIGAREA
jgi:hypothetical protein